MRKAIKEKILQQKKGSQFYVKMICEGQSSLSREVFGRLFLQKKRQNVHMENWMQRRLRQNAVVQRLQ